MQRQEFASTLNLLDQLSSEELAELEGQVRSLRSSRKGMDALENRKKIGNASNQEISDGKANE